MMNRTVRILVFTEGTVLMHKNALGKCKKEILTQIAGGDDSLHDYATYAPVGNAVEKLRTWQSQGAEISYLTSRTSQDEINAIQAVLSHHAFPYGHLTARQAGEQYADTVERLMPDILIEDDCQSIGGAPQTCAFHLRPEIRKLIKLILIEEFRGIDELPESVEEMLGEDWV
jgi:hypothetical protein